jgi:DNA-directed RNA polymerase beta subunit
MDEKTLSKLERGGAVAVLPSGRKAVHVSIQFTRRLDESSRLARRHILERAFEGIVELVESIGGQVVDDSLSVSAQTIEAMIPTEVYDDALTTLESVGVRVDPVILRQVV